MTRLSIRWHLTLWYGISLAVILCSFCLLLLLLVRQQMFARTDAALREEVKEIGLEIDLADNAVAFQEAATARFTQHSFYEFLVTGSKGEVIFASSDLANLDKGRAPLTMESADAEFTTRTLENSETYRVALVTQQSEFGVLDVQVLRSLSPLLADLRSLLWAMAGLLPLGVLGALAIGHFLAGRALSPVQRVVDVADSIDITCLNRRIEVANSHDEIGKLASALNSLIDRLEQAVSEIRRFTADASHEIRTPIAVLRAEAEAAIRMLRTPEEYARALAVVVDEATRLGQLTDQLLHLSRDDAGITRCAHEPVQLDALLRDVTDQLRPLAIERGLTLDCNCEVSAEVLGDDIRLSQAFFNVIENAIKYTDSGGHVGVRLRCAEQQAVIEITDSGVGIPPEHLTHVFDRFFRVDPSRERDRGGAGLGLSIAKAAVAAHRGTIEIRSHLGLGTGVSIYLPVCVGGMSSYTTPVKLFKPNLTPQ